VLFLPTFWVGFLLIRFVAIPTGWFPVSGFGSSFGAHLRSVALPGLALALALAPVLARSLRSSLVEVLDADYVAAARAMGVRGLRLMRLYVLRNALAPSVSLLAVQLGFLLFGVVVLEYTFNIYGLGSALVTAAGERDLPVLQGITLLFAVAVVLVNLLAEVISSTLDPRLRSA
jgi:peptide/nickel transport system permease protein